MLTPSATPSTQSRSPSVNHSTAILDKTERTYGTFRKHTVASRCLASDRRFTHNQGDVLRPPSGSDAGHRSRLNRFTARVNVTAVTYPLLTHQLKTRK
jgi:hypothetical protein